MSAQSGSTRWVSAGLLIFDSPTRDIPRRWNLYRQNDFNVLNFQTTGFPASTLGAAAAGVAAPSPTAAALYSRSPMAPRSCFSAPVIALVAAVLLAACGSTAPPSGSTGATVTQAPAASASATPNPAALAAYSDAICAIFPAILAIDPRIAHVRDVAVAGGDMTDQADEMTALTEAMLPVLEDLEALPDWEPGRALRFQLITALHGIRTTFLLVAQDPSARAAAEDIVDMPFIATDALDRAMSTATQGGLTCTVPGPTPAD